MANSGNVGDIAHTPGVLALLERYIPEAEIFLWPSNVNHGVGQLLEQRFPELRIIRDAQQLQQAFQACQFLLHGSGPSLVAERDVVRWQQETGKPYGVYGITLSTQESTALTPTADERFCETDRCTQPSGVCKLSRFRFA